MGKFFLLSLAFLASVRILPVHAEASILKSVLDASKAVVSVQADAGGVFGDQPQGFVDPSTGEIVILRKIMPVQFTRTGAGVIIDPSGLIVTNAHTVVQAGRITVTFQNGESSTAQIVHTVPHRDLAFIKPERAGTFPTVELSDSDRVAIGLAIYSVGNSPLRRGSIGEGSITGIGTQGDNPQPGDIQVDVLQVNLDLFGGDSGTPVFDGQGKLLGIVAAAQVSVANVTYAIPSNAIRNGYLEYRSKNS